MADHSDNFREAIIERLKTDPAVLALVPVERIYDESPAEPVWPFIRYGFPIITAFGAACWDAAAYQLTVHAFARGPGTKPVNILARTIVKSLVDWGKDAPMLPETGAGAILMIHRTTVFLNDTPDRSAYHAAISFDAASAELVG